MITYEDLLGRFSKMAEDRFGAGGILPSQAEENTAQNMPSHDAKEKADLPDSTPQKLTFADSKVKKGPEEQKINKNVFMTRAKDSTIKQAFVDGFVDELQKEGISTEALGMIAGGATGRVVGARRGHPVAGLIGGAAAGKLAGRGAKRLGKLLERRGKDKRRKKGKKKK